MIASMINIVPDEGRLPHGEDKNIYKVNEAMESVLAQHESNFEAGLQPTAHSTSPRSLLTFTQIENQCRVLQAAAWARGKASA